MDQQPTAPKLNQPSQNASRPNQRRNVSEAEMNSDIEAIVSSLRNNPARLKPVLSLATGRAGSRQIIVQTGECQSLSRAIQDLDRVMLYASSRSLFSNPETLDELNHARTLVTQAASAILESIAALAESSGFDVSTLNSPEIRRILMDRKKQAKKTLPNDSTKLSGSPVAS